MGHNLKESDLEYVRIHAVYLGEGLKGFAYVSRKGISHIFISESLSPQCAAETIAHEMYHLKHDKVSHGIGLDRQLEETEKMANKYGRVNASALLAIIASIAS